MIVITTPTGTIGQQVLAHLLERGAPLRVIARDPSRLPSATRERVDVVQGSHDDGDVVNQAFAGAGAVFWLVPPDPHAPSVEAAYLDFTRPACEAFTRQRVQRVVGVSALGRGVAGNAGLVTTSLAMDDLIASTGVAYRALTMPSFMDNVLRQVAAIKGQGTFFSPLSPGPQAPARRDCRHRRHRRRAAARSLVERAGQRAAARARGSLPARHGPDHLGRARNARALPADLRRGLQGQADRSSACPSAMAQGTLDMMLAKNEGLDNAEPRTPQSTTPTSFRHWCEDVLRPAVLAS